MESDVNSGRTPNLTLVVNAGSSSLKLAAFDSAGAPAGRTAGGPAEFELLRSFVARLGAPRLAAVAHRVVHGGHYRAPVLVDEAVIREIGRLAPFAPLHNPPALEAIRACEALLGAKTPQVAVFDTAFFADLPAAARSYAIPRVLAEEFGLRRYGFHGIAHASMWRAWQRAAGRDSGRMISLQLGAGCSMAAVCDGRALDTSMGFSPLEGLVMATRCGDIDAGVLFYLQRALGWPAAKVEQMLNRESGLLGVSGATGDMRALLESNDPQARFAIDLFCYRARQYVGAYLAVLGGADAVVFGGGIGENAPLVRERILEGLEWAGLRIDLDRNRAANAAPGTAIRIDGPIPDCGERCGQIGIWVAAVSEEEIIAREAAGVLKGTRNA